MYLVNYLYIVDITVGIKAHYAVYHINKLHITYIDIIHRHMQYIPIRKLYYYARVHEHPFTNI
jgi:hypothetical protein